MVSYTRQDSAILHALICSDVPMTVYAISKDTGIAGPQVNYRLRKLVKNGVVDKGENEAARYTAHPILGTTKAIKVIAKHISKISDVIGKYKVTTIEGMKILMSYILEHTRGVINGDEDGD